MAKLAFSGHSHGPKIGPPTTTNSESAEERHRRLAAKALETLQGESDNLQSKAEKTKQAKFESVEDDYLVGPLSIESYVVFRTRPILERLERRGRRLAIWLQVIEVIIFVIQALGTVLAAIGMGEWVAFTVTLAGLITERIAASSMREQLVSTNLASRSLSNKVTLSLIHI